jgi:hypothetical protein
VRIVGSIHLIDIQKCAPPNTVAHPIRLHEGEPWRGYRLILQIGRARVKTFDMDPEWQALAGAPLDLFTARLSYRMAAVADLLTLGSSSSFFSFFCLFGRIGFTKSGVGSPQM